MSDPVDFQFSLYKLINGVTMCLNSEEMKSFIFMVVFKTSEIVCENFFV